MEREAILDVVKQLLVEKAGVEPSQLSAETTQSEVGIDSIHMVDLMMDIEERLGVTLQNYDLQRNPSLGDIADMIQANIGAAG
jgi:acyl carrier protein